MDYFNAFWVGGLICALVQILLDKTKLLPGRVMVLLVCSGAVLSFLGFYQPFIEYAGAGASVPLLGFGNILWKGMKKAIDEDSSYGYTLSKGTPDFLNAVAGWYSRKFNVTLDPATEVHSLMGHILCELADEDPQQA